MSETIIFGADWCGDCRRAKLIFERAGAPYRYVDLVQDPAAVDVARDISGRTNIPVIVYPDRSHQVGPSNADMLRKISELGLGATQAEGAARLDPPHDSAETAP
ncbi:NrdH-redoxin [Leucobacter muris]|uniref:NrdH-redoxin n=1 Tax=Leucobacter muris TaxID=1935379 RepID=A0ABX5QDP6_9MICO|nr:glutaredoxin domain-containing protein [Leucobacter muris]QAB17189.1 NrdH-redoxin [Leucobacter muris]